MSRFNQISTSKRVRYGAVAGAAVVLGAVYPAFAQDATATAPAAQPNQQELLDRLKALEAEVHQLRAERQQASEPKLDQHLVDSTVDAVLEDARRRTALLGADAVSIHYMDGRLLIRSADGNFQLHPWLQFQFRDASTYREGIKQGGSADDLENGFEVRRLKFGADGNIFSTNLTYMTQFAVDRRTGNTQLEMAWAKYHIDETPFALRLGQFKDPLDHEQLEASRNFAPVERTLVNDTFTNGEGFVHGVSLLYEPGDRSLRSEIAFTDGLRNYNNNFQDYPTAGISADWGAAARVEYKLFGRWREYDKFSAYDTREDTLAIGGGLDYTEAGHTGSLVHVADIHYVNAQGWLFYGAYLGRYTKDNTIGNVTSDTYDWTLRGLVSYSVDRHWEPYLEYSYIHFDPAEFSAGTENSVHMITLGTNYYLYGHNAKFQLDVSYLPNGSPVSDDGAGVLIDNHKNELILRGQFQLLL